jgi:hypothetical protein
VVVCQTGSNSPTINDVKKLHNDLLKNYNPSVRPVKNQDRPIVVYFGVAVVEVAELMSNNGRMSIATWLRMVSDGCRNVY